VQAWWVRGVGLILLGAFLEEEWRGPELVGCKLVAKCVLVAVSSFGLFFELKTGTALTTAGVQLGSNDRPGHRQPSWHVAR